MTEELTSLDAVGLAGLVRSGEVTAAELAETFGRAVERLDAAVNAVPIRRLDRAYDEARALDGDGAFRGVPIVVKDALSASAGDAYHMGSRFLRAAGNVGGADSHVVRRLRRAGFVLLGRTNVPEFCTMPTTEPLAYGPTRNPRDPARSTGGSSGGSAAAVAAGMVPLATGSDGGGSIRFPAGMCGVVGLKPSRGRVSAGPDAGQSWGGLFTEGVLARTVRDAAALLDVMSGPETGDPYTAPGPRRPYRDEAGADPGRLRVGLLDGPPDGGDGDPACRAAVRETGRLLEGLGHHVEMSFPAALGEAKVAEHQNRIVAVSVAAEIGRWERELGRPAGHDEIEPVNRALREQGRATTAVEYVASETWLHVYARRLTAWWEGFDLLVLPTASLPAPPLGWWDPPDAGGLRWESVVNYTTQFNVTGQPAVSLPLASFPGGLPLGVQVVAAYGREDLLLAVAAQMEAAAGWDAVASSPENRR